MLNSCQRSIVPSSVIFAWFARVLASNVWKTRIKMQSERYESSQRLVKLYFDWFDGTSFSKHVAPVCLILSAVGSKSLLKRRCKKFCFTKLTSTRSPQSHQCLNAFFLTVSIVAVSFLRIPFTIIWACMEASRRNKPSIGIKALPRHQYLFLFLFYRIVMSWLSYSVSVWSLGQHVCRFSPAIAHLSSFWCFGNLQNHPVSLTIYASLLIANSKSVLNIPRNCI